MSRIGKKTIIIPNGVTMTLAGDSLTVKGPKGTLQMTLMAGIKVTIEDTNAMVTLADETMKFGSAAWGLYRALIQNMVTGVSIGFSKKLEINGVGFKMAVQGSKVVLNVGFSHPVEYHLPQGIAATVDKNVMTITGTDRQLVGEVAASIRAIKKPEPYKGKGIKYIDEVIRRKEGKVMKSAG